MKQDLPDYFETNMALLQTHRPEIWEAMTLSPPDPVGEIFFSENGRPNLRITDSNGQIITMHADHELEEETDKCSEDIPPEATAFISILGMGLGYGALHLLKQRPRLRYIAIFELNPGVFAQALRYVDLSPLISDPKVLLAVSADPDVKVTLLPGSRGMLLEDFHTRHHLPSVELAKEAYQKLADRIYEVANGCNVMGATSLHYAKTFMHNRFRNLSTIHHDYLMEKLQNSFAGVPAFIVAAGPSLDKNIEQLPRTRGKALIIAADSALPALLAHDVTPEFVTTLDPQDVIYEKIASMSSRSSDVSLVCCTAVTTKPTKLFPAKKIFWVFTASPIESKLSSLLDGTLLTGGAATVAHLSFQTAVILGCSPIIFVGQDLAYTDNKDHAGNTTLTDLDCMKKTLDTGFNFIWADSVTGGKVATNRSFYNMKNHFEDMIVSAPGKYINASEGGVDIIGTEIMPLKEAIDTYCSKDYEIAGRIHPPESENWHPDVSNLLSEFRLISKRAKEIKKIIGKLNQLTRSVRSELTKLLKNKALYSSVSSFPPPLQNNIREIDSYNKALDSEALWKLVEDLTLAAVRDTDRMRYSVQVLADKPEKFIDWLLENLKLLDAISTVRLDALDFLEENISAILDFHKKESKYLKKAGKAISNNQESLELCRHYFETGNMTLLQKIIGKLEGPQSSSAEIVFYRGAIAAGKCEYEEMDTLFDKAVALAPSYAGRIDIFRQKLANEYWQYDQKYEDNSMIDANSRRRLLIKGLRYCNYHQPSLTALQDTATKDLEKIASAFQSDSQTDAENLIRSWCRDLEDYPHLASCLQPPNVAYFYTHRGNLFMREGEHQSALVDYQKALFFSDDNPDIHIQITDVLFALGNYTEGMTHLRRAVELDKKYAAYWENIGNNLQESGQHAEAVFAYEQCFIAMPANIELLKKIGDCYLASDQLEAAKSAYTQFKEQLERKNHTAN